MKLRFVKANPCGNTTIFILDPVPRARRSAVAAAVMAHGSVTAEQVGFIFPDPAGGYRMEMAGGEFCGNASRSFAAWLQLCPGGGEPRDFTPAQADRVIRVSGAEEPLTAHVRSLGRDNACYVSVAMPLPERILTGEDGWFGNYSLVIFPGISHLVLWSREHREEDVERAKEFLARFGPVPEAFGLMYYDEADRFLRPLVYVEEPRTLVWENSCGSGSSALAAAIAHRQGGSVEGLAIRQPGGELTVSVDWQEGIRELVLGGEIALSVFGTLYI
ncbi:hypothetical protein [Dysosmobacter sp.]|uniref:hypothetical protein n=1 Tax=Dysosmobacter sp. TaxID=2591382 RepID=UPI002A8E32FD|nr:hypothetical protein [Dysosmobacter sp.]MDY3280848.1 hypothetical protein [Dysosmobacter sp.]